MDYTHRTDSDTKQQASIKAGSAGGRWPSWRTSSRRPSAPRLASAELERMSVA